MAEKRTKTTKKSSKKLEEQFKRSERLESLIKRNLEGLGLWEEKGL